MISEDGEVRPTTLALHESEVSLVSNSEPFSFFAVKAASAYAKITVPLGTVEHYQLNVTLTCAKRP